MMTSKEILQYAINKAHSPDEVEHWYTRIYNIAVGKTVKDFLKSENHYSEKHDRDLKEGKLKVLDIANGITLHSSDAFVKPKGNKVLIEDKWWLNIEDYEFLKPYIESGCAFRFGYIDSSQGEEGFSYRIWAEYEI